MPEQRFEFESHRGQWEIYEDDTRFKVMACGRRWGKTLYSFMYLTEQAYEKKGLYWWVAPWYKELIPVSQIIKAWLPPDWIVKKLEQQNVIRYLLLDNGSEIYFHSADTKDALRGSGLDGVVVDEAASVNPDSWSHELRPSLMDSQGWAIFIGTPKGRNWFYYLWVKGQDSTETEWRSWQMPTSVNPHIDSDEIESFRKDMAELVYRQEILAEFLEGEGTIFRKIDDAVGCRLRPGATESYALGCDLAKTQDWTVLTALDPSGNLVGLDRFNQLDWPFQKKRIVRFAKEYKGSMFLDASGLGGPIFDDLEREGLNVEPFKFTNETKKQLIEHLSIKFDAGAIKLPTDPEAKQLINELKAFTYTILPSGRIRYEAPQGIHDDCVISLALAAWGMEDTGEGGGATFAFGGGRPRGYNNPGERPRHMW